MTKEELIIGFFEKGYCCDLDEVKDTCLGLLKENQELKNQLEDKDNFINKLQATKVKLNKWDYENTMKQQKFLKYLEDELKRINPSELTVRELVDSELDNVGFTQYLTYKEVLQKYKKIVNGSEQF